MYVCIWAHGVRDGHPGAQERKQRVSRGTREEKNRRKRRPIWVTVLYGLYGLFIEESEESGMGRSTLAHRVGLEGGRRNRKQEKERKRIRNK
jgi:hypothetical protein